MSRPTSGVLTGAGYAQVGATTKYTKAATTATMTVDVGNGNVQTGVGAIGETTSGTLVTQADYATAIASLAAVGAVTGPPASVDSGRGLVYFGATV